MEKNDKLLTMLSKRDWLEIKSKFLKILKITHNEHCAKKIETSIGGQHFDTKSTVPKLENEIKTKKAESTNLPNESTAIAVEPNNNIVETWNYTTEEILGGGSCTVVIGAQCKTDSKKYAIKIIPNQNDSSDNEKSLRESRNQASLSHRNVVKYISSDMFSLSTQKMKEILKWELVGSTQTLKSAHKEFAASFDTAKSLGSHLKGLFIKTEICGETLREWLLDQIKNEKSAKDTECKLIGQGIVDGINYIHSKSILHRDLRPENIFFAKSQFTPPVKIGDFGLSNQIENQDETQTLTMEIGNYQYRAPEVNEKTKDGKAKYSKAADAYSIGLILSEIYDPQPVSQLNVKFSTITLTRNTGEKIKETVPWLSLVILKLTEKTPADRFDKDSFGSPLPISFTPRDDAMLPSKTKTGSLTSGSVELQPDQLSAPVGEIAVVQKDVNEAIRSMFAMSTANSIDRYALIANKDKADLNYNGESKKIQLSHCHIHFENRLPKDLHELCLKYIKFIQKNKPEPDLELVSWIPKTVKFLTVDCYNSTLITLHASRLASVEHYINLSCCNIDVSSMTHKIGPTDLKLYRVSFIRNKKNLNRVLVNDFLDILKIDKLTLNYKDEENINISIDLSEKSASILYLELNNVKVENWKKAECHVHKLNLWKIPFEEKTKMIIKELETSMSTLDVACLPPSIEKLDLRKTKIVCTRRTELPNLKHIKLTATESHFHLFDNSPLLTHIDFYKMETVDVDLLPKNVTQVRITNFSELSNTIISGKIKSLHKLVLVDLPFETLIEALKHFQPMELVVYRPTVETKDLMALINNEVPKIFIGEFNWENENFECTISKHVEKKSKFYLFAERRGRSIEKSQFHKLREIF